MFIDLSLKGGTSMKINKVVDLSMDITNETPIYPGDPKPDIKPSAMIERDGYNVSQVNIGSHTGTHVDAPFHFNKDGLKMDEVGITQFLGNGLVINVTGKKPGTPITLHDVESYLDQLVPGVIVLFHTGWSTYAKEEIYYTHPYVSIEVIEEMLNRGVRTFLIDALNIDPPDSSSFAGHEAITNLNGIIGENLTNIEAIDFLNPFIITLPLKLKSGDGSPVRAVAIDFE